MKEFLKCSVFLSSFIFNLLAFYHKCAEADKGQSQKLTIFKSEKKNFKLQYFGEIIFKIFIKSKKL